MYYSAYEKEDSKAYIKKMYGYGYNIVDIDKNYAWIVRRFKDFKTFWTEYSMNLPTR